MTNSRSHSAAILTAILGLATAAASQGLLRADESYHHTLLLATQSGGGGCGLPGVQLGVQFGQTALRADGRWSGAGRDVRVCPDGTVRSSTNSDVGTYTLHTDGRMSFHVVPALPSHPVDMHMRFDHGVLSYRSHGVMEPGLLVALRQPSSPPPSLAGSFYVVRLVHSQNAAGMQARTEAGLMTVAGGGSFTEVGLRHRVTAAGAVDAGYTRSGTLAVAADGQLAVGPGARQGAVSADGELLFWIESAGAEIGLTLAVRRGSGYVPADLDGAWVAGGYGAQPASSQISGTQGRVVMQTSAGTLRMDGIETVANSAGASRSAFSTTGTLTLTADGRITTSDPSGGNVQLGGLSASGRYVVLADVSTAGRARVAFGFRECVEPESYGTATAGTGAIRPLLAAYGGAPRLGNSGFGLRLSRAAGGAPGAVVLAARPAPGLPAFGGLLWLDGGAVLSSTPLLTSGLPGAAGAGVGLLPLPVGSSSSLLGADFYAQAFVLDPGAPAGVSMTRGLAFDVCQ